MNKTAAYADTEKRDNYEVINIAIEWRETWRYSVKLLSVVRYIDILGKFKQYSTKIAAIQTNWK